MQGIKIGNRVVVGTNAVVTHDCEDYGIYVGVPERLLKKRFDDSLIKEMLDIQWWNMSQEKINRYSVYMLNPLIFINKVGEYEKR